MKIGDRVCLAYDTIQATHYDPVNNYYTLKCWNDTEDYVHVEVLWPGAALPFGIEITEVYYKPLTHYFIGFITDEGNTYDILIDGVYYNARECASFRYDGAYELIPCHWQDAFSAASPILSRFIDQDEAKVDDQMEISGMAFLDVLWLGMSFRGWVVRIYRKSSSDRPRRFNELPEDNSFIKYRVVINVDDSNDVWLDSKHLRVLELGTNEENYYPTK